MLPRFASTPLLCALLLLAVFSGRALAQSRADQNWAAPLVGIYFSGSERFSQQELEQASGLERAAKAGPADFKAAADRLASTGAFREVGYTFEPSGGGVVVRFALLDQEEWLPVRFENLVWFSDDELLAHLRQRVPLFRGEAPPGSRIADDLQAAVEGLLRQRGITAPVRMFPAVDTRGRLAALSFSVEGASMPVASVEFPGSTGEFTELLAGEARVLQGRDYGVSMIEAYAHHNFQPVYLRRGYLRAEFGAPRARLAGQAGDVTRVAVELPVREGRQYRLSDLVVSGSRLEPEELRHTLDFAIGAPMDAVRLEERLGDVRKLYGTRGYLQATTHTEAEFDEQAGTVLYRVQVREGELFRMGQVRVEGLEGREAQRLASSYRQKPGEPFNAGYEWRPGPQDLPAIYRQNPERTRLVMRLEPQQATRTVNVVLGVEVR